MLVAVADGDDRRIVGTVMLQPWPHAGEVVAGPDEAEIRALAVAPDGQGRGTGRALLRAVIERAALTGVRHLVLLTQPEMQTAQRMYQRAGFVRLPERNCEPAATGVILLAYGLVLTPGGQASGWSGGRRLSGSGRLRPGGVLARRAVAFTLRRCLVMDRNRKNRITAMPKTTRKPACPAGRNAGRGRRQDRHKLTPHHLTLSRTPAKRSSSGFPVSTTDLARW